MTPSNRNPGTDRAYIERFGFMAFVGRSWEQVESTDFLAAQHLKIICRHLEYVAYQATASLKRPRLPWMDGLDGLEPMRELCISVPPGAGKSLLSMVMWPAWIWTWCPQAKIGTTSYSESLALRDAKRSMDLMQSEWYQERWPEVVIEAGERASTAYFVNTAKGSRFSCPMNGQVTGRHFHILCFDDPAKPSELVGPSAAELLGKVTDRYDNVFSSRSAHPPTFCKVVIAQRLHELDLTAHLVKRGATELLLPMEYDSERHYESVLGSEYSDWRTTDGELLIPNRFPQDVVDMRRQIMSSRDFQAQLNQRASPADGSVFRREWFNNLYVGMPWGQSKLVLSVDAGLKETKTADHTCMQVWAKHQQRYYLVDQVRFRGGFTDQVLAIKALRIKWVHIGNVLIESKANGEALVDSLKREFPGVIGVEPLGGKESRAHATEWLWNSGSVWLPESAPWLDQFIDEHLAFPVGKADDSVDSCSMVLNWWSAKDRSSLFKQAMGAVRKSGYRGWDYSGRF